MNKKYESDLYILAWQRIRQLKNDELLCFIFSRDALVRDLVIQQFHLRPSEEVFRIATALLSEKTALARSSGYLILGQLGTPDRPFREVSMPAICHGLEIEKASSVRCAIAYAIGHIQPPKIFHERIIDLFLGWLKKNVNSKQKEAIAFAVSGLSESAKLDTLLYELLKTDDADIVEWVKISVDAIRLRHGDA